VNEHCYFPGPWIIFSKKIFKEFGISQLSKDSPIKYEKNPSESGISSNFSSNKEIFNFNNKQGFLSDYLHTRLKEYEIVNDELPEEALVREGSASSLVHSKKSPLRSYFSNSNHRIHLELLLGLSKEFRIFKLPSKIRASKTRFDYIFEEEDEEDGDSCMVPDVVSILIAKILFIKNIEVMEYIKSNDVIIKTALKSNNSKYWLKGIKDIEQDRLSRSCRI